jgi:hypothetical protein
VKDQRSNLSLGYKLGVTFAIVSLAIAIFHFQRGPEQYIPGLIFFLVSNIFVVWGSLARQRMNTFQENLEIYRMIQQLREDK